MIYSQYLKIKMRKKLNEFLLKTEDPGMRVPDYFDNSKMNLKNEDNVPYSWKSYMAGIWKKQNY